MSKLTQASNGNNCIRCGAPDAYAAHYNGPRQMDYGKGRGIKCHDMATADLCHRCDQIFTEGSTTNPNGSPWRDKWDRSEEFLHLIMLTNIRRFENNTLTTGVKKDE